MNTGKILIGLTLLLIMISLVIHPAAAQPTGIVPMVGYGNDASGTARVSPSGPPELALHPRHAAADEGQYPVPACSGTSCVAGIPFLPVPPRTRTNDEHRMHIPAFTSPSSGRWHIVGMIRALSPHHGKTVHHLS